MDNIITGLISGFVGAIVGYFGHYFQAKAKNQADLEDIGGITDAKEKVSTEYQLNADQRRSQYEFKRAQYFKYFEILDEMQVAGTEELNSSFFPELDTLFIELVASKGNKDKEIAVRHRFVSLTERMLRRSDQHLTRMKNRGSQLRIIASDEIMKIIEELMNAYYQQYNLFAKWMRDMPGQILSGQQEALERQQSLVNELTPKIEKIQARLHEAMKRELDSI